MSYLIQASPYSKIVMREYQSACEQDPVFGTTPWDHPRAGKKTDDDVDIPKRPFKIIIPRSLGAISFVHNEPKSYAKVMPNQLNRKNDDNNPDELANLINWLAGSEDGPRSEETAIYGVVRLGIDLDVGHIIAGISDIDDPDKAKKEFDDLHRELQGNTKKALKLAREEADEKVMAQVRITFKNLQISWENMKSEGKGVYSPSVAEFVGAEILKDEIQNSGAHRRATIESLSSMIGTAQPLG